MILPENVLQYHISTNTSTISVQFNSSTTEDGKLVTETLMYLVCVMFEKIQIVLYLR